MTQSINKGRTSAKVLELRPAATEASQPTELSELLSTGSEHNGMKLIPWHEIWASLTVAKIRGNGEMIEVFYDTLFKEAVFDDRGAWALDLKTRN
jgi:hypothetical protein